MLVSDVGKNRRSLVERRFQTLKHTGKAQLEQRFATQKIAVPKPRYTVGLHIDPELFRSSNGSLKITGRIATCQQSNAHHTLSLDERP